MNIEIRTARLDDLPQIVEIYNQAVRMRGATADLEAVTVEARQAWFESHSPDGYPLFVGLADGRIVGWCSLSPHRPGRAALRRTAEISYYVHEGFRRRGVGSALIAHVLGLSPSLGFKCLFAILLDVNGASVAALEKFGFERWGHLPNVADIDGKECGQFIYGRRVD